MPKRPQATAEKSGCFLVAIPVILLWAYHPEAPWWHWVGFGMASRAMWDVADMIAAHI